MLAPSLPHPFSAAEAAWPHWPEKYIFGTAVKMSEFRQAVFVKSAVFSQEEMTQINVKKSEKKEEVWKKNLNPV